MCTYLQIKDLIRCSQVNKRFRNICQDMTLWQQINLCGKKVPCEFIYKVLENGCKYLSFANSRLNGGLHLAKNSYPLKYLDLSNCDTSKGTFKYYNKDKGVWITTMSATPSVSDFHSFEFLV